MEAEGAKLPPADLGRFPRVFTTTAGQVVVHAPEIESWADFERVTARSAIEVTPADATAPALGTVRFSAATDVSLDLHMVAVQRSELSQVTFPGVDDARAAQLEALVRAAVPGKAQQMPLEVVLEYIGDDTKAPSVEGLLADPPPIYVRTIPAVLVITDGEPLLVPVENTSLRYVVNTNWDLFSYQENTWYLLNGDRWLRAQSLEAGTDWLPVNRLPDDFQRLPANTNWTRVLAQVPAVGSRAPSPEVIVSDRPAELIALTGAPQWEPVGDTSLQSAVNTASALFRYEGSYYFTASGRWFTASDWQGDWAALLPTSLPEVFAEIPEDHALAAVRAAVPGTPEARLATLEALIPRKATVKRDAGAGIEVKYQGEPQFVVVDGVAGLERAINTPSDVLRVGETHYLCEQGVWFTSPNEEGPWEVADAVPPEVYGIPPSSPAHHVTNVYVYDSDEDTVETGYTAGYVGVYVSYGIPWYGTGYYYPPYWYYHPYYGWPVYWPYPYSYGFNGWYNPTTGNYGRTGVVYGPYGGYGRSAFYNPRTGAYGRGEAIWDSNEIAGRAIAYNPRSGTGVATRRYASEDGVWGESIIARDDRWLRTESEWTGDGLSREFTGSGGLTGESTRTREDGVTRIEREFSRDGKTVSSDVVRGDQGTGRVVEGPEGQKFGVGRSSEGDLYAGRDGNVYRRDDSGWSKHTGNGGWEPIETDREISRSGQSRQQRSTSRDRSSVQNRNRELDRSYQARRNGYSRYNGYRRQSGQRMPGRFRRP